MLLFFVSIAVNIAGLPIIFSDGVLHEQISVEVNDETSNEPSTSYSSPRKRLKRVSPTASDAPLPPSNKNGQYAWSKSDTSGMIPLFPHANYEDCRNLLPHEQFEKFFDDDLLKFIISESSKYAVYRHKNVPDFTIPELRTFIGILIISGYNAHSAMRHMWSQDDDLRNILISKCMRRDRFQEICHFLHFEDSGKGGSKENPNPDSLWKLRPLTDHLKAKMIENFHPEQNLSYDESMIAYFGKHGCKQFIKGF